MFCWDARVSERSIITLLYRTRGSILFFCKSKWASFPLNYFKCYDLFPLGMFSKTDVLNGDNPICIHLLPFFLFLGITLKPSLFWQFSAGRGIIAHINSCHWFDQKKRLLYVIMEAENPNLEMWTKKQSVQFNSIILHIAWNQGCRVTIHRFSQCWDGDKGGACSHHNVLSKEMCSESVLFYYSISVNSHAVSFPVLYVSGVPACVMCFKRFIRRAVQWLEPLLISWMYSPPPARQWMK